VNKGGMMHHKNRKLLQTPGTQFTCVAGAKVQILKLRTHI
jgi:hypothetical protein